MSLDIGFASQTPSLPSGGGSLGGLGETFAPDLCTGTGTFSVPLDLPNGPNDSAPKLTLRYDTGSPNGPFGLGWTLSLPRLLRGSATRKPRFDDTDDLVLEGAGPLLRLPGGSLRPQVDSGDWRIERVNDGFLVTDRMGTQYELGTTPGSRILGNGGVPFSWLLSRITDNLGLRTEFTWRQAGEQRYLQSVVYGAYRVSLTYEPRPDPLRFARAGFLLLTQERCTAIELHLTTEQPSLVRRWSLTYADSELNGASLLASITLTGHTRDGSQLAAPPLKLGYSAAGPARLVRIEAEDVGAEPPGLADHGRVELVDWDGDGLPDLLEVGAGGATRVWPNHAGRWGRPRSVGTIPQLAPATARAALIDFDGDGLADLVRVDEPLRGFQPRTRDGLGRPVHWDSAPSMALVSSRCRLADLDGDGMTDLLWSTGDALLLSHRRDPGGWEQRPLVVPAAPGGPPTDLSDPHIYVADMTGDGTPDLVRVDGRGVTYWPYLGDGSFGAPVIMGSPPILPFDTAPERVFVVDIDGDGCADVVVVDNGAIQWWPNRAGNDFRPPRQVRHLPTGAMTDLRVADLLGTGSPALCWSVQRPGGRAAWFALDLVGGVKPGLLVTIDNSIGKRTEIHYSSSSLESVRDRNEGTPWTTRLPIVLPVVGEVTVSDQATARVDVTRYRYHNGRYDGVLREVCGFGRVDTEDVGDPAVPTLCTTRWFHIGLNPDGSEPGTTAARRRARAIRGRVVRQECSNSAGALFDRVEYEWEVEDAAVSGIVVPRLRRTTKSVFEGAADPTNWIVTEQTAFDADGNAVESLESSFERGTPAATRTLRTRTDIAASPAGRFRQRTWRVRQEDANGNTLAETITEYDNLAPGQVGAHGLVTARIALAITDDQVNAVYGNDPPDFAALGYVRRPGSNGWWVNLARYDRIEDANGLRGTVTGARGGVTRIEFDPTGCYPARVTDTLGNTLTASFDPRTYQPTLLTNPAGQPSTANFDALARLESVIEPGDTAAEPTISYEYRTAVMPVEVRVRQRGAAGGPPLIVRQFLDGQGRLLERRGEDDQGEVIDTTNVFGPRGLPVSTYSARRPGGPEFDRADATGPHVGFAYDALGRKIRTERADGAVRSLRYLPGLIEEIDEQGRTTRSTVDAAGRIVRIEQPRGPALLTSSYVFDLKGKLLEHVDGAGMRTTFAYDLLGRLLRIVRPESTQLGVFDAAGNMVETRTGAARVFRTFDLANRLIEVRYEQPNAAPVQRFAYHDSGLPAPADAGLNTAGGRLVRIDDEGGSTVLDYDQRGRLAKKVMTPVGQAPLRIDLTHRSDGLVDSVTYPAVNGLRSVAAYRYNRRGKISGIDGVIDSIEYDLSGLRTQTRFANGTVEHNEFDPLTDWRTLSRIEGPGGVLREVGYRHDQVGNLLEITSPDAALAWNYQYDLYDRLVGAASVGQNHAYTYDNMGNLLSSSDLGAFGYGANGAPATCLTSAGPDIYTYDDRGNVRSAPWGVNTFDAGSQEFNYGHQGVLARRREIDANGVVTHEILTPDRLVLVENAQIVIQYWDGEQVVARQSAAGDRTWLHYDHLGSAVLGTDAAGVATFTIRYGPYGTVLATTGAVDVPQGFAAGISAGPALVLLGARWYCPRIGRFLSADAMIADAYDPLAWNRYAYARCNPTSLVDPSGRSFWKVFGMILAAIAIIAVVVVVSVFTFGIATPGAIAIGGVTWGAVFAATMVGVAAGGIIGGIAAARAGGDAGDILLGVLVGGAVGGWAAFGAAFAGPAAAGLFGLTPGGVAAGAVAGGVSGAINGAAMGFATGFAGGKNNGLKDIMEEVLVGAILGAAVGAALGALSGLRPPAGQTPGEAVQKALTPDVPSTPPSSPGAYPAAPPAPINSFTEAATKTAVGIAGRVGGNLLPFAAQATAGFTGSIITQTVLVDLSAAGTTLFFDDIQSYVRTHNVNLGPFNFIKSGF